MRYKNQTIRQSISYIMLPVMVWYIFLSGSAFGKTNLISLLQKDVRLGVFSIRDNPYKYSGYYCDPESGMYYCQARYYSPELMRFINRDNYDLSNRYAYCNDDPVNNVDPSGHMAFSWTDGVEMTVGTVLSLIPGLDIASGLMQEGITQGLKNVNGEQKGVDWASIGIAIGLSVVTLGIRMFGMIRAVAKATQKVAVVAAHPSQLANAGEQFSCLAAGPRFSHFPHAIMSGSTMPCLTGSPEFLASGAEGNVFAFGDKFVKKKFFSPPHPEELKRQAQLLMEANENFYARPSNDGGLIATRCTGGHPNLYGALDAAKKLLLERNIAVLDYENNFMYLTPGGPLVLVDAGRAFKVSSCKIENVIKECPIKLNREYVRRNAERLINYTFRRKLGTNFSNL